MNIYWVTILVTKIRVCEGCEGCTARKSGPDWRLVRAVWVWVWVWVCGGVRVPVAPDRSPSYTNFSQLNIGLKSQKSFSALRAELHSRTLQKRIKIVKNSRRFAPNFLLKRFTNASKS